MFYVATQQFPQSCVERGLSLSQNSISVNYANLRIYASELRKEKVNNWLTEAVKSRGESSGVGLRLKKYQLLDDGGGAISVFEENYLVFRWNWSVQLL